MLTDLGELGDGGRCFGLHSLMEFRRRDIGDAKGGYLLPLRHPGFAGG